MTWYKLWNDNKIRELVQIECSWHFGEGKFENIVEKGDKY